METFVRVSDVGQLVERDWKNSKGENVVIASIELTVSNGLDEIRVEATDALARTIDKVIVPDGLYRARIRFQVREGKEKKLKFNSARLVELEQL